MVHSTNIRCGSVGVTSQHVSRPISSLEEESLRDGGLVSSCGKICLQSVQ